MGLDVYLYNYANKEEADRLEKLQADTSERIWNEVCGKGNYNNVGEEKRQEYFKKLQEYQDEIGYEKIAEHSECIDLPSKKYPEGLFRIGYFRSSYNGGGINNVMGNAINMTLYDIFPHNDDYSFMPDWEESKKLINKAIKKFRKYINENSYTAMEVDCQANREDAPKSSQEAITLLLKEKETHKNGLLMSYSSNLGTFYLDEPMEIIALIKGKKQYNFSGGNDDCIYAVMKTDLTSYLQSLEVVRETINYVLNNEGNFYLHWSS